jgi:protein SCO1/2
MTPRRTAFALLGILLLTALPACRRPVVPAPPPADDGPSYPVGAFALTERGGRTVRDTDLRGKVWVASFVFTRCTGPCPQVTATMARLQSELAGEPDVRLVTFTVDPERDDPAELKRYAEHFHADPERWLFLTGPEAEIHRLLKEGFKVGVARAKDPTPGQEFDHSTRLVVVDRRGNARGYFEGVRPPDDPDAEAEFEANLQRLKQKVAELLRE